MAKASQVALVTKMEGIILTRIGETETSKITPDLLDKYVANRAKDVKQITVHQDLTYIRSILRWSVRRRYLAANPMDGFELPRRDNAVITPPTVEEARAILKAASPHLYRAIVLSYYTGLLARRG